MVRKIGVAALLLAGFAFAITGVTADDKKEEKTLTLKDCMKFQGKNGLATKVNEAAKADKWDDAAKVSADLVKIGEAIGKNTPPKNADKKDEWEKQTKAFAERTKAVDDAVKTKKADGVSKAVTALLDQKTCGGCHSNFKGK